MLHCGETYHNLRYASCGATLGRIAGRDALNRSAILPATCQHDDTLERSKIDPRPVWAGCLTRHLQIAYSPDAQAEQLPAFNHAQTLAGSNDHQVTLKQAARANLTA